MIYCNLSDIIKYYMYIFLGYHANMYDYDDGFYFLVKAVWFRKCFLDIPSEFLNIFRGKFANFEKISGKSYKDGYTT